MSMNGALFVKLTIVLLLSMQYGCTPKPELADLREFTSNAFKDKKPEVEPVPRMEPYQSFVYGAEGLADPFKDKNIDETVDTQGQAEVYQPERRRETLEQFALGSLSVRGTMFQEGRAWVLVGSPDGGTHRAAVGNYMGHHSGKIIDITEREVVLREVVKGPSGDWVEREVVLSLLE